MHKKSPKLKKRIYTCTPISFEADDWFFIRDTGLISRELQQLGYESKCILPLPYHQLDHRDCIIRASMDELHSSTWWQSLNLDIVILYSWGSPHYIRVARAIKEAGINFSIHLDMAADFEAHWDRKVPLIRRIDLFFRRIGINLIRAKHLRYANVITCTETAKNCLEKRIFYGQDISSRMHIMPSPIASHFRYDGSKKEDIIIANARWENKGKREDYLIGCCDILIKEHKNLGIFIIGSHTQALKQWHDALPTNDKSRVKLLGFIDNKKLPEYYQKAIISLCLSEAEGTHLASAEALCCGASIVTSCRPELAVIHDYTRHQSGCISQEDSPESIAAAISDELKRWQQGQRSAQQISDQWLDSFNCHEALPKLLNLLAEQ